MDLFNERCPVGDIQRGIVFGGKPTQPDREDDDEKRARKERRHRKADHGKQGSGLIKPRVLPVRGINPNGHGDQNADQVGGADHRQGLRHALADDGEHRAARLPGQDALLISCHIGAEPAVKHSGGFNPEELPQPQEIAHEHGLIRAQSRDHLLPHIWRHGQGNFGHRRSGGQIDQQKDHQRDDQQGRYGQQKPAEREGKHTRRCLGSEFSGEQSGMAGPTGGPAKDQITSRGTNRPRSTILNPMR